MHKFRFFKAQIIGSYGLVNDPVTEAAHEGRNDGRNEGRSEGRSEGRNEAINETINEAVNGAVNEAVNDTVNCRQISFTTLFRHHSVTLPPVGGITVDINVGITIRYSVET